MRRAVADLGLGFFISSAIFSVIFGLGALDPKPYKNVELISLEPVSEHSLDAVFSFEKTGCTFESLNVIGILGDISDILPHEDISMAPYVGDRLHGTHTLSLRFPTNTPSGGEYDSIEIRTRHSCDYRWPIEGSYFHDQIFYKIENN